MYLLICVAFIICMIFLAEKVVEAMPIKSCTN